VGPQLSPMQIRQITTRLINGSYEDTYRASLTVLQDQGYIIKNTDMASGLIVANVDRSTDAGSQLVQALFLGYISDKGSEIEVSCMVNKLSNTDSEIRLNIQETNYGQASRWSGTSKQNVKHIYDQELYAKIFNEIELEVKRRQAISGMSDKNVSQSSRGAVIPIETNDNNSDSNIESVLNEDSGKYLIISKIVKSYFMVINNSNLNLEVGEVYEIVSRDNQDLIGKAKIVKIQGNSIAFQIINNNREIKINDKIQYNK
jgi:TusA-related sulfurtransferase